MEPVRRSHADARRSYDRISRIYDRVEGPFEARARRIGLRLLGARRGERVLDVGHGTGHALVGLARDVGADGVVAGVDASAGMQLVALRRLRRADLDGVAHLVQADATALPLRRGRFDAVFMSFVLELFDTPEIPLVLAEVRRVLVPAGRVGVVALGDPASRSLVARLYLAGHRRFPRILDCRPIPTRELLREAGYRVDAALNTSIWGLPVDVVVASTGQPRAVAQLRPPRTR